MCGRFYLDSYHDKVREFLESAQEKFPDQVFATGEIYPSSTILSLGANQQGEISPGYTKWGFTNPRNKQLLINARSETVTEKPTFKTPFNKYRCVFPMTGYYEWDKDKKKHYIQSGDLIFAAGFFRRTTHNQQTNFESIILTQDAAPAISTIHNRMPVLIPEAKIAQWILDNAFAIDYLANQAHNYPTYFTSSVQ